mgnify:CR=1 FL=1
MENKPVIAEEVAKKMKLYRLIASEAGPTKLFVGGLPVKEGLYTAPILEPSAKDAGYAG